MLVMVHEWFVVVVFWGDWGVFVLRMDFKEVMLTSPPELAHFGGEGGESVWKVFFVCKNLLPGKFLLFLPLRCCSLHWLREQLSPVCKI